MYVIVIHNHQSSLGLLIANNYAVISTINNGTADNAKLVYVYGRCKASAIMTA